MTMFFRQLAGPAPDGSKAIQAEVRDRGANHPSRNKPAEMTVIKNTPNEIDKLEKLKKLHHF